MLQRIDWKTVARFSEVHIPSIVKDKQSTKKYNVSTNLPVDMHNIPGDGGVIWTPVQKELTITDFTGIQAQI